MTEDKSERRAIDDGQGGGTAADAPTAPFEASEAHARLRAMAGSWRGPTKTWLDPSAPPEESTTYAR
ncbi:MAG TPA: DUF1579 family protein, partial [Polyangiaceae bacterium]|nr:DUF1579 family protein [Polyangiaceae bacterium]